MLPVRPVLEQEEVNIPSRSFSVLLGKARVKRKMDAKPRDLPKQLDGPTPNSYNLQGSSQLGTSRRISFAMRRELRVSSQEPVKVEDNMKYSPNYSAVEPKRCTSFIARAARPPYYTVDREIFASPGQFNLQENVALKLKQRQFAIKKRPILSTIPSKTNDLMYDTEKFERYKKSGKIFTINGVKHGNARAEARQILEQ